MKILQAYHTHPRRIQLTISLAVMTWAGVGLFFSQDQPDATTSARVQQQQQAKPAGAEKGQ
ncbi:hypothetical protein C8A05DRAFT_30725 [Staphylotrichum tortipilum]|uniref:Uncharacterized protein n=1 Tax=Staphylotrichum tortipilum TaxID=2831512 RepID=A0AAN6MTL0_9PEZI|nr:hypothetical protein C8A05DRAFT_30725 [Staphylotrichum longicolle]